MNKQNNKSKIDWGYTMTIVALIAVTINLVFSALILFKPKAEHRENTGNYSYYSYHYSHEFASKIVQVVNTTCGDTGKHVISIPVQVTTILDQPGLMQFPHKIVDSAVSNVFRLDIGIIDNNRISFPFKFRKDTVFFIGRLDKPVRK